MACNMKGLVLVRNGVKIVLLTDTSDSDMGQLRPCSVLGEFRIIRRSYSKWPRTRKRLLVKRNGMIWGIP